MLTAIMSHPADLAIDLGVVVDLGDVTRISPDAEGLGSFLSHSYPFYKQGKNPYCTAAREYGILMAISSREVDRRDARESLRLK